MARSVKKAIYKDVGYAKRTYHKVTRSNINQTLREAKKLEDLEELEIPEEKTIVNDYSYCDYRIYLENDDNPNWEEAKIKFKRK